ncbi:N-acetylmuramoyl-L-alanine amidase [Pricia sp. S334]|uniref:N-acetylmuramoyl-L-alanine amidase n=1 Tax=Pricia mediterranea TaxID=3076079 RepID=A0ABU3L569_9FLAO|nr:N-acetylmuramoyl-L-alanine amidase [Pricia sp. S334]MDT7828369.1 N-acetylmuramoyl-L-alanine amidase [Pricia sp. S334]
MKRSYLYFFLCVFAFGAYCVSGQDDGAGPIIVIDPGHGGMDSGTVGINGRKEKEVVLKIAAEILRLNRELYRDRLKIYSTRYIDTLVSLKDRAKLANALKASVLVSIHFNYADSKDVQGFEVYIKNSNEPSAKLGGLFVEGLSKKLGLKNRGSMVGNFHVLRESGCEASVLLELGFLSNEAEAGHIGKESSISAYALSILETMFKYLGYD